MLPVVDSNDVLVGVVTVDDVLDVAEKEAAEDIQKLGGVAALEASYLKTGIFWLVKKRAPWLAVLFIGERFTSVAMQNYGGKIQEVVVLAFIVPLILSSGGKSGSQPRRSSSAPWPCGMFCCATGGSCCDGNW